MLFKRKTEKPSCTEVDNRFITDFLPEAPELAVKVYLYGLMLASDPDRETDIAKALGADDKDITAALAYLEAAGLVEVIDGEEPMAVFGNAASAVSRGASASLAYSELVRELSSVLGTRVLSGAELSRIYDWIEVFGFSKDAAVEIVRRCLDKHGAKTSAAYMDKVAKTIAGRGAFTLEAVREYFSEQELLSGGAARICRRWHRRGAPTDDELALYEKWTVGWGLDDAALDYALTKMTAADKPSFAYLDSVIETLYREGNTDREHIEELTKQEDTVAELARQAFSRAGIKHNPRRDEKELFREWHIGSGMSAELILLAADYSKDSGTPFVRLKSILNGWHEEGISSLSAAKESYERNEGYKPKRKNASRALNYMQGRTYSEDELKKIGISLGEEFYDEDGR